MKYKEIIDRINQKKEKDEDYYEELLSLEKEVKGSEPTVRPQLLYMMGVDHLVFEDTDKAFELQFSAFNHIIHTIYSDPKEIEVLSSTLQKVIIEMSKMISPTQPSKTIKMFYQKEKIRGSASLGEEKLRKMVREFREVRRLFPENNEIFNFLVQEDPKESLLFITNKTQTDLLVEKMKGSGYKGVDKKSVNKKSVTESVNDFMEVIIGMRRIKRTNKVLVLLFLYDEEKYGEYVKEVRKGVVLPPRTPSNFEILTDILTSCVSTGRVEALKGLLPDLLGIGSLLSKREKELVRMVYSDIYKVFTPENPPDEFVDLEQVVFFWFITGEYSKILRVGERVCKKVLFVAYSRSRGEGGERERKGGVGERGDHSKDEIYKEDCIHTTPYSTAPYSTPPIPSIPLTTPPIPLTPTIPYSSLEDANEMEKIGFSWKIENEFLKERVKFFLRMGDTKRVRETVEGVQGLPLLVEVLNVLREEKAFTLLRGIVLRLLEREKMVFTGKKVLLSFLHLKEIEIEVRERLRVIGGVCSRNSKVDGKWLYNNLVDVYNSKNRLISPSLNVDESIGLLLSLSLSIESFTISILLISPSNLPLLYKKFIKFTGGDSEEGGESVGEEGGESVGEEGGESVVRDSIRDSIREEVGDIPNLLPYSPNTNTNTNPNLSTSLIKILFYEAFLPLNPKEAEGILRGINLKEVEDSSLLYLLGLKEVERTVVLESHFRGVLLPSHLEGIIVRECLKGTLFLYDYLRSVVVIKIENYLTKESRAILTATLRMVEQLKSVEMILFFQRVVKE